MSLQQATDSVKLNLIEFRMAIFWFCLFSVNSLCTCLIASLVNCNWSQMDGQSRLLLYLTVAANWTGCVMAFVSKQASRIKKTGGIFPDDTQFITRAHSETDSFKISGEARPANGQLKTTAGVCQPAGSEREADAGK